MMKPYKTKINKHMQICRKCEAKNFKNQIKFLSFNLTVLHEVCIQVEIVQTQ